MDRFGFNLTPFYIFRGLSKRLAQRYGDFRIEDMKTQFGTDPSDYIFEHARETVGEYRNETLDAVAYSVSIIETYFEELEEHDIRGAILIYPHLPQLVEENKSSFRNGEGVSRKFNRLYEESIEQFAFERGIPFKSFYEEVEDLVAASDRLYFKADMHFNPRGLRLVAENMAVFLASHPEEFIGIGLQANRGATPSLAH